MLYWCKVYGIDSTRIYFVESGKKYCKECPSQVATFMRRYNVWKGVHMLSDAGHSMKKDGEFVFEMYGCKKHRVYEPVVHGELSPNDNLYHKFSFKRDETSVVCESDDRACLRRFELLSKT